jgi:membrane-associated phospholipid phosphatase
MAFRPLLVRSVLALAACAGLVALCYYFVDRPVAFFVHDHDLRQYAFLKWMTYTPIFLEPLAPLVLVLAAVRRAWGPLTLLETTLAATAVSLMITLAFKEELKVAFGRYWPATWINHNPSLLGGEDVAPGGYGFHPFAQLDSPHPGWYDSFPSGHTARICALASVPWGAYRRWRWALALVVASVAGGLLGMNYHFVGDVVAGGTLGWLVGVWVAAFCRVNDPVR